MRGFCKSCQRQLFWQYGDGDHECAACRERRAAESDVIARDRAVLTGYQRIERCPAHAEPEPCSTCAALIAAGL